MTRGLGTLTLVLLVGSSWGCQSRVGGARSNCSNGQCSVAPGPAGGYPTQTGRLEDITGGEGAMANYLPNGGQGGPLAGYKGRHHRGPQSHTGPLPGPAMGPAQPTVTYPYYTTRGPRDFLNPNPPSIGY